MEAGKLKNRSRVKRANYRGIDIELVRQVWITSLEVLSSFAQRRPCVNDPFVKIQPVNFESNLEIHRA